MARRDSIFLCQSSWWQDNSPEYSGHHYTRLRKLHCIAPWHQRDRMAPIINCSCFDPATSRLYIYPDNGLREEENRGVWPQPASWQHTKYISFLTFHADKKIPHPTFHVLCLILIWRIFYFFISFGVYFLFHSEIKCTANKMWASRLQGELYTCIQIKIRSKH